MSILRARSNGAWVDTSLTGSVRYQDASVSYGPPTGGPSYEAVDWLTGPALTDASDNTTYSMGCSFTVLADKLCYGIRWRVPDSVITPSSGSFYATLWQVSPTLKIKQRTFTPTPGVYQDILFDAPTMLLTTEFYVVSVMTVKYVFRAASSVGGFPLTSPSGNVVVDSGKLAESPDPDQVPGSTFPSIYYVSPLVAT